MFHSKVGVYGLSATKVNADSMSPIKWWLTYGHETMVLEEIAIKVLAKPIISSSAQRSWVHTHLFIMLKEISLMHAKHAYKLTCLYSFKSSSFIMHEGEM